MGTQNFAARMRKNPTRAEKAFLRALKQTKAGRRDFDFQVVLGNYIADFFWKPGRMVIEIDGSSHQCLEQQGTDLIREAYMKKRLIKTIRLTNAEVLEDPDRVVNDLLCKLYSSLSSYSML